MLHRHSPALTLTHSPQNETHTQTCSCSIQILTTTSRLRGMLLPNVSILIYKTES